MRPLTTVLTLCAAAVLALAPAYAGDHPDGDHAKGDHHGADCCGGDPHPMGPGGMGPHHGMGPHGKMMGDGRMHMDMARFGHSGPFDWHPNRLRAAAIDFLAADVYRLAILPFNDITDGSPINSPGDPAWNERELRDNLAGALLETGILVLPAENVEAALRELKGIPMGNPRHGMDVFENTILQVNGDGVRSVAAERIYGDRDRMGLTERFKSADSLSQRNLDYTPEEIRMMADALDVDGFILGSFTTYGTDKHGPDILGNFLKAKRAKLAGMVYVVDGATGEPIYGKRIELARSASFLKSKDTLKTMDDLVDGFAATVMHDLSHPVPGPYIHQLRAKHGIGHKPMPRRKGMRHRWGDYDRDAEANYSIHRDTEGNLHDWKQDGMQLPDQVRDPERARNRDDD